MRRKRREERYGETGFRALAGRFSGYIRPDGVVQR